MSEASKIVVSEAKWSLQAARIIDLERQLAEAQEPSDLLLRGLKRQYDGELTSIEAVGFALGRIGALERQLEAVRELQIPHAYKCSTYDDGGECDCHYKSLAAILGEKGA